MGGLVGRTSVCTSQWESLTNNKFVLGVVKGIKLKFTDVPWQAGPLPEINLSDKDKALVDKEVGGLLQKGAVVKVDPVPGQFVSNIFLVAKKSGGMRPVINLKKLNKFLAREHFKMEHIFTILPLLHEGCFMTSLDLKDAYFSIPMSDSDRKYLRFLWRNVLYEFQCLCFGLSPAPFYFTKVMKPVFSRLRKEGVLCSYYIDDSIFLDGNSDSLCRSTYKARGFCPRWGLP